MSLRWKSTLITGISKVGSIRILRQNGPHVSGNTLLSLRETEFIPADDRRRAKAVRGNSRARGRTSDSGVSKPREDECCRYGARTRFG
jgi:hypothetical protein